MRTVPEIKKAMRKDRWLHLMKMLLLTAATMLTAYWIIPLAVDDYAWVYGIPVWLLYGYLGQWLYFRWLDKNRTNELALYGLKKKAELMEHLEVLRGKPLHPETGD